MKKWYPTGVSDLVEFRLTADHRRELQDRFRARGIAGPSSELTQAIENAIACYHAESRLSQDCLPGKLRKNLRTVEKRCLALFDALNNLDGLSRYLLHTEANMDLSAVRLTLETLLIAAGRAEQVSDSFPNSRLPDFAKRTLACDIARVLQKHGHSCTTYKDGLFHELVACVFQMASGKESSGEVERMVRIALAHPNPTVTLPQPE